MDDQALLTAAARRSSKASMSRGDWVHVLSLDMAKMSPSEAGALVDRAVAAGLLAGADTLALSTMPAAPAGGGFLQRVDEIATKRGVGRDAVLDEVRARQEEMGGFLSADVAVLWVAHEAGLDVEGALKSASGRE